MGTRWDQRVQQLEIMASDLHAVASTAGIENLVANLATRLSLVRTRSASIPMTENDGEPTCYICAPTVAYADYALEELRNFRSMPALQKSLEVLVGLTRPLIRSTGLDRQFQPNNWLLSTNIWCGWTTGEIAGLTAELVDRDRSRAIVWRSLNDESDRAALEAFRQAGYRLLPARQVYLYDCRKELPPVRRDMRNDLKLLARTDLGLGGPETIGRQDFASIADLYNQLYRIKYTGLNPAYTPRFMEAMHDARLMEFHVLRETGGRICGVIGFFAAGDVLTAPVVGYDLSMPQEVGLYRRLVVFGMMEARRRRLLYNMSAGAALFKRTRGACPAMEYTAIYNRHLALGNRLAARVVETLLTRIGVPLMKRFEL